MSEQLSNREMRITTADQVVSSLANLVFVLVIAQVATAKEFALITTLWTALSFSIMASRSVFGVPLLLAGQDGVNNNEVNTIGPRFGASLFAAPLLIALLGIGLINHDIDNIEIVLFAICIPLYLLIDFGRYEAIANRKSTKALAADFGLLLPLLLLFTLQTTGVIETSVIGAFSVLMLGLVISLFVFGLKRSSRVSFKQLKEILSSDSKRRKKLLSDSLLSAFTAMSSIIAVWIVFSSSGAAAYNGALYIMSPITLAVLVVNLVIQHSLGTTNGRILSRDVRVMSILVTLSIAWTLCIASFPENVGSLILGETWKLVDPVIIVMGFVLCLSLIVEFVVSVFRARAQFSEVVVIRLVIAVASPLIIVLSGLFNLPLEQSLGILFVFMLLLVLAIFLRSKVGTRT
jgi:hypothetical protein